jgi:hypothetical protein
MGWQDIVPHRNLRCGREDLLLTFAGSTYHSINILEREMKRVSVRYSAMGFEKESSKKHSLLRGHERMSWKRSTGGVDQEFFGGKI